MNKLINRKVLISMIFIGLTMMGLFSYRYLLMELYPDAEFPSLNVTISTKTELDPKYIESQAAIPVEGVISGLEGVEDITTLISNRNARITVSFTRSWKKKSKRSPKVFRKTSPSRSIKPVAEWPVISL